MRDLDQIDVGLLLTLADYAEEQDRPMVAAALMTVSGLEEADFAKRLGRLIEQTLVRSHRAHYQLLTLTGNGTFRVLAERAARRTIPLPGARSRLGPLAEGADWA